MDGVLQTGGREYTASPTWLYQDHSLYRRVSRCGIVHEGSLAAVEIATKLANSISLCAMVASHHVARVDLAPTLAAIYA